MRRFWLALGAALTSASVAVAQPNSDAERIRCEAAAKDWARRCATVEGILVGISSGATLAAIAQKLPDLPADARVLGFNYDTGERYLSVPDFLPE